MVGDFGKIAAVSLRFAGFGCMIVHVASNFRIPGVSGVGTPRGGFVCEGAVEIF